MKKVVKNTTVQSATVQLQRKEIDTFLSSWIGTIQWIGSSPFRKYHKRKNWFIGLYELDRLQLKQVQEKDLNFQTMRSSGPGGQHVNKTNSAVRAIHQPTGIFVVAMDSRSQHQNKKLAIQRIKEKVLETQLTQLKKTLANQWENHLNVQRGNPIRVFRGTDFKGQKTEKTFKSKRLGLKNNLRNDLRKQQWD